MRPPRRAATRCALDGEQLGSSLQTAASSPKRVSGTDGKRRELGRHRPLRRHVTPGVGAGVPEPGRAPAEQAGSRTGPASSPARTARRKAAASPAWRALVRPLVAPDSRAAEPRVGCRPLRRQVPAERLEPAASSMLVNLLGLGLAPGRQELRAVGSERSGLLASRALVASRLERRLRPPEGSCGC